MDAAAAGVVFLKGWRLTYISISSGVNSSSLTLPAFSMISMDENRWWGRSPQRRSSAATELGPTAAELARARSTHYPCFIHHIIMWCIYVEYEFMRKDIFSYRYIFYYLLKVIYKFKPFSYIIYI